MSRVFICPFCEEYNGSAKELRSHIKVCKSKDVDDDDNLKNVEKCGEKRRKIGEEKEEKKTVEEKGEKEKEKEEKTEGSENILSSQTLALPPQPSSPFYSSSSSSFLSSSSSFSSPPSPTLSLSSASGSLSSASSSSSSSSSLPFADQLPSFHKFSAHPQLSFPAIPTIPPPDLSTEEGRARDAMERLFIDCLTAGDTQNALTHFRKALECSAYHPTCYPFSLTLRGLRVLGCPEFQMGREIFAEYGLSDATRAALLAVPADKLETVFRFLKGFGGSLVTFDEDFQEYLKKQREA